VFVFEELTRRFRPLQVLATLAAATVAMAIMQAVLGEAILFHAGPSAVQPLAQLPVHFVLGACLGIAGVAYATLTTWFLDVADRMRAVGSVLRAGIIGAVIGAVGWFFPHLIGGGEGLVQLILTEKATVTLMLSVLAARVVLSPLSYAAGVPGGLFAPLLVLGAACGTLGSQAATAALPALAPDGVTMAVVGMAAIFTAVVRAPLTGIVLTIEMTGRADCALAMLTACLAATLFASLVGGQPIYDVLRERMLSSGAGRSAPR
jgi:CIC family chloride channel protein